MDEAHPGNKDWAGKQAGELLDKMRTQSRFGSRMISQKTMGFGGVDFNNSIS